MTRCDRCGNAKPLFTTTSYFDTATICETCDARERAHPRFKTACDAEVAACRSGNYNFKGIGCPPDLRRPA